jgi:hypothetical protein
VGIDVPAGADFNIVSVDNQYGCSDTPKISMYRRPLPTANLMFLSAVMWDGRESAASTGTTKISYANYPASLLSNLRHQSVDATTGHAQGNGLRPTAAEQQQIVDFEMSLFSAQSNGARTGQLNSQGASGGPDAVSTQPFFVSINSSVHFLLPGFEQPGGMTAPQGDPPQGDGQFTPNIFNLFDAWKNLPARDPRAAVARGQELFNSKPIFIEGVAGINDDVAGGGLVGGGITSLTGTCGTCHDTPNAGNHSFPTPLNIGVGDIDPSNPSVNLGGLDISYLPRITACKKSDPSVCVTTTDLGQALLDGNFNHIGKLKGPVLRGLASRAPYFHNGSAQTLLDVVKFYEVRFGVVFTSQEESDLVAFLGSL